MRRGRWPVIALAAIAVLLVIVLVRADNSGGTTVTRAAGQAPYRTATPGSHLTTCRSSNCRVRRIIRAVFGTRYDAAVRVARCESNLTVRAISPTGDYGLFQANYAAHHYPGETTAQFARRHFNVRYHVRWAYRLSRQGTYWLHWAPVCRP